MQHTLKAVLASTCLFALGCAVSRPCQEAGDITWSTPPIKGNKQCRQKKGRDGVFRNDGQFIQWHENGNVALSGEFKDGKKTGKWTQFDETGKKVAEKFFEDGTEVQNEKIK